MTIRMLVAANIFDIAIGLAALLAVVAVLYAVLEIRYVLGRRRIAAEWQHRMVEPLAGMGSTRSLEILPLIDWFSGRPGLRGEAGVSYLIKTDHATILLDVGLNLRRADPSPLLHNMQQLGVAMSDIDTVVISHNHIDHVGGLRWLRRGTFSPGNAQPDLSGKQLVVPVPLNYPGNRPIVASRPTGACAWCRDDRDHFEPIVYRPRRRAGAGCECRGKGYRAGRRLWSSDFAETSCSCSGVVQGTSVRDRRRPPFPVPHGRITYAGMDVQNFVVFGLTHVPSLAQVRKQVDQLADHMPQWVSVSAHDSSDEAIEQFRCVFGERYHELRVGEWQHIAKATERPHRVDLPRACGAV